MAFRERGAQTETQKGVLKGWTGPREAEVARTAVRKARRNHLRLRRNLPQRLVRSVVQLEECTLGQIGVVRANVLVLLRHALHLCLAVWFVENVKVRLRDPGALRSGLPQKLEC